MNRHIALIMLLVFSYSTQAQDGNAERDCPAIDDDTQRLACYDSLSGHGQPTAVAQPEIADEGEVSTKADEPVYVPLDDDFGAERLQRDDEVGSESRPVRATITDCKKDATNRYYFFFDNGQVWKQKDDDRLRFKSCNFSVTIIRDVFGYKMQIDGEERRTRIGRVR